MVWAQLSPLLSRAHAAKRNATRDPAQEAAAKRRRTHSQRSLQRPELSARHLIPIGLYTWHPTQRGASGGVLEVGAGCGVRPAHAERCPGFSAGRILTRKGASPGLGGGLARPGCDAGAARKRLRRRDDTSAAPKRGARDQGVARGARRTRRWAVRPAFLTFARPAGRGEPIAPRAPPRIKPEGKPG